VINTNDLIGLTYGWGHRPDDGSGFTDCFQLTSEVLRRFNYKDYSQQFAWVYTVYTDKTFPRVKIARWLLENGTRIPEARSSAVVLLPAVAGAALGTILEDNTAIYLGPSHNVVRCQLPAHTGHFFWMER
jgi:hypothetical protein